MNLNKLFFRDKTKTSVDAVECWEVRWRSRFGEGFIDVKPEVRVFHSKAEANEFKNALVDAFKLIKNSSDCLVKIKKQSF